jgi:anti-anti-sigma factor
VEIDVISTRELAILRCRGRLVLGDGAALLREVARRALAGGQAVALDLGRVTQMDAHATGVLAELTGIARDAGRPLMLARVSDRVRHLLRLSRLDTIIPGLRDAVTQTAGLTSQSPVPVWSCRAAAGVR